MIRAVCFDLDGTLFDDREYVVHGLEAAAAELEVATGESLEAALLAAYFEDGHRKRTFDVVLDRHGLSRELVPRLVAAYHGQRAPLSPFPEAKPLLERLRGRYRLGLLTGGRNGQGKLEQLGLEDCFDEVIVAPDVGLSKRDADPYELLLERLAVPASEAVYVGDRPELDFPWPNRLGMPTVRVHTGRYADSEASGDEVPTVAIGRLDELPDVLERLDRDGGDGVESASPTTASSNPNPSITPPSAAEEE